MNLWQIMSSCCQEISVAPIEKSSISLLCQITGLDITWMTSCLKRSSSTFRIDTSLRFSMTDRSCSISAERDMCRWLTVEWDSDASKMKVIEILQVWKQIIHHPTYYYYPLSMTETDLLSAFVNAHWKHQVSFIIYSIFPEQIHSV